MIKKRDYQKRGSGYPNFHTYGQRGTGDHASPRENSQNRNLGRDSTSRQGHLSQPFSTKHSNRSKAVETVEDIRADILRLEKEIQLEIKEIRSLKL